jgi:hypothetical protein
MQQQIRGWRIAAERTPRRRASRGVPTTPSARMMEDMLLTACRALGRMPSTARTRRRTGIPATMPRAMRRAMRRGMPRPSIPRGIARPSTPRGIPRPEGANMMRIAGGVGLAAAGMGVARWMSSRTQTTRDRSPKNRWIMVTVNCSPQRLASRADLPEPITRLGDAVDIKIAPAPGDRGTELGARLRELPRTKIAGMVTRRPEEDPRQIVEKALREAKSMIEAGEVLRPDWPVSAQPAQVGKLLEFAGRRGGRS